MEVRNFIRAQERRDKSVSKLMVECSGKFEESRPTILINVTKEFHSSGKDWRKQVVEGWYHFWKLRAGQNGVPNSGKVVVKVKYEGTTVGYAKDDEIKVKR